MPPASRTSVFRQALTDQSTLSVPSLIRSTSTWFESQQALWPAPEKSVGSKCQDLGGLVCWQAIGPALEVMNQLSLEIKVLFERHQDSLEQCEDKPRTISYNMWMVGFQATRACPTIVISSKSKRQRYHAKALLRESKLLDSYPGVKIKTLEKVPAVYYAAKCSPGMLFENFSNDGVYLVEPSSGASGACGSLIAIGPYKLATLGLVIKVDGAHYGTSAQHSCVEDFVEAENFVAEDQVHGFDEDSDLEDDDFTEITSRRKSLHI